MTRNTTKLCRSLAFISALALAGGVAMAEKKDRGSHDGDRPKHHQNDKGEHDGKRRGPDRRAMHKRLFAGLELTDEQKEQVKETLKKHGEKRKAWHEAHKDEMQELRQQMKAAVKAVHEKMKAMRDSAPKPGDVHDDLRSILNDEQRASFDERVAKFKENREKWQKRRKEGGPEGMWRRDRDGDGDGPQRREGRRRHMRGLFKDLDLTDEQKKAIRETMQSDGDRKEKMKAIRDLLTEDQQAKLDENRKKMKEHREQRGEDGKRGEYRRQRDRDGDGDHKRGRRHHDDNDDDD